ncbi:MAG: hypothetical protein WAL45_09495, partial [Terracidiphilus sp.]
KLLILLEPSFPHRHNASGTHDSICNVCLTAIATVQDEWELDRLESARVCGLVNLYRAGQSGWRWEGVAF